MPVRASPPRRRWPGYGVGLAPSWTRCARSSATRRMPAGQARLMGRGRPADEPPCLHIEASPSVEPPYGVRLPRLADGECRPVLRHGEFDLRPASALGDDDRRVSIAQREPGSRFRANGRFGMVILGARGFWVGRPVVQR